MRAVGKARFSSEKNFVPLRFVVNFLGCGVGPLGRCQKTFSLAYHVQR
jgi:hypothetical protein